MPRPRLFRLSRAAKRRGFTLVELMCVISITGVLMALSKEPFVRLITHSRVNRAATVVAGDLETALTLASRTRRPVRISFDTAAVRLTITDRAAGTVYVRRELAPDQDYHLSGVTFSPRVIDIFPSGVASGPLHVTLQTGGYQRDITMSRASFLRVVPL